MAKIVITKKRPDGSEARLVYVCQQSEWDLNCLNENEKFEMLLEAEMRGNSSSTVRIHFDGFCK